MWPFVWLLSLVSVPPLLKKYLRILCILILFMLPPGTLPRSLPFLSQICVCFFPSSIKANLCCLILLVCSLLLELGWALSSFALTLSQQLRIANRSSAGDETLYSIPLSTHAELWSGLGLHQSCACCHKCWVHMCSCATVSRNVSLSSTTSSAMVLDSWEEI